MVVEYFFTQQRYFDIAEEKNYFLQYTQTQNTNTGK